MKLEQLRFLCALVDEGMNMSRAAERLRTSQPGVSKQMKLLEAELRTQLLRRGRHRILGLTPAGVHVVELARRILGDAQRITAFGNEAAEGRNRRLTLATTHLHASYVFPPVLAKFREKYPDVELVFRNGEPKDIYDDVSLGKADLGVATTPPAGDWHLLRIPGYELRRLLVVPVGHPISKLSILTLEDIASYPLITYCANFAGSTAVIDAFERQGLQPAVAIRTMDTESIKKYVRLGLGIAVLHSVAIEATPDPLLTVIDVTNLFGSTTSEVVMRPTVRMAEHYWHFIELLAPAWNRRKIATAIEGFRQKAKHTEVAA